MPYALAPDSIFSSVIGRGLKRRCPRCGEGRAFKGYLTVVDNCAVCGEQLGHIRADDFPPYLTILLVGHIVVPLALMAEQEWSWSTGLQMGVWLPTTLVLLLLILPMMKGAAVGFMWRLGLSGNEKK
jgi:uncharacterized protein (DUF983 family)